jgi:3-oxoacyl-[acyl-carrier protein] reductase
MLAADSFKGRTAIVTGATRGIGAAIAKALLEAGAQVIGTYRGNNEAAEKFKLSCGLEAKIELHAFDVAEAAAVQKFYESIASQHPVIDILINNGGIRRDSVAAMMKEDDWRSVIDTNLTGSFFMTKQAILNMMRQRYGRIVNISSPMSRLGFAGQANYSASKAGLEGMTRAICKEVASRGITINCVLPGFIDTELLSDLDQATRKNYEKMVPVRRFGKPEEVAEAVLFLAQESSSYITGTTLEISGGI